MTTFCCKRLERARKVIKQYFSFLISIITKLKRIMLIESLDHYTKWRVSVKLFENDRKVEICQSFYYISETLQGVLIFFTRFV